MQWDVKNIEGKVVDKIDLPEGVFGVPVKKHLLFLAAKAYLANKRQGTHMARTRAFVSGGGKKPFKQKGTGSARQGTTRAPQHSGGAAAFGPLPRCYRQRISRDAKHAALCCALSDKVRSGSLTVIDDFRLDSYRTKHVVDVLKILAKGARTSALLSDERKDDFLARSSRNIIHTASVAPLDITALDVMRHDTLVLTKNAVRALSNRLTSEARA